MSRTALTLATCAVAVAVAMDAGAQVPRWQCSPTGARALDPALAEAASDYLGRVEAIYPYQALGLVRAGERFYLLNTRDVEWSDRTRLQLLALRLQDASGARILRPAVDSNVAAVERHERGEPYLTPERQSLGATPGSSPPAGSFVCLAVARAEREGLTRTPLGDIFLAAGHSVHFVDPQEPQVAVEVKAAQDRPLNLGEIFRRSSRTGIYAGLTGSTSGQARPAGDVAARGPADGALIIRLASAGGSATETRVEVPEWAAVTAPERPAAPSTVPDIVAVAQIDAPAPVQKPVQIEKIPAPTTADVDRPVEDSGAVVAARAPIEDAPAAAPAAVPPAPVAKAAPEPVMIAVSRPPPSTVHLVAVSAKPAAQPGAGQTYEEYAKAMKTLMELRRSGAVRSISEMTYVHPAVEVIRYQPR